MSKNSRSRFDEGWGLCFHIDGRVTWGVDHGWGQSLPHWLKEFICDVFNSLTCMVQGHDPIGKLLWLASDEDERFDPPKCTYCGAEVPIAGKYVTADMLTRPHWKDVPPIPGVDYPLDPLTDKAAIDALVAKGIEPWTTEDLPSDEPDDSGESMNS